MLTLLLACSSEPVDETPTAVVESGPTSGDTLVMTAPFDPGNLNPIVAPYQLSGYYIGATQLGLVERRTDENGLLHVPSLAESWEWSPDGTQLTFHMVKDAVWSDGTPVTSADAVFTFELILDPAVASNWHAAEKKIASVEAPDDHTVVFTFKKAGLKPFLLDEVRHGLLPRHVLQDADRASLRGHEYSRMPMSTGPWKVTAWEKEAKLVLEPNDLVTARPKARLDRVITKIIPEYATQLIEFENGSVDLLMTVELADIPALEAEHPELDLLVTRASGMEYIGWNTKDPVFSDVRVRTAMTHAIDVDKLIADIWTVEGSVYAQRCLGTVGPDNGDWVNRDLAPLGHDPDAARALLTEAGWVDADGDGIRDKDGKPLRVDLMIQNSVPKSEKIGIRVQAMLREVGVDLQIQALEPNLFSTTARNHEFQAILWGFGNNPKVDPTIQWHSTGQYNWMQYSDPEVDRLLDEAMSTTDLALAQKNVREAQALVYAAQPATFLVWQDDVSGIHSRFRDVKTNTFTLIQELETWWVPTAEQKYR